MLEFIAGYECASQGYSIHYNPYRHKGSSLQFVSWENGWKYCQTYNR
jgi:hypothetical protein